MKTMTEDTVFYNGEQQIEMIFPEVLELETLDEMLAKADLIISDLNKRNSPPSLLADVSIMKKISSSSRQRGTNWILKNKNLSIAIYGKNTFMKHFVNFLVIATRKSSSMKFFKTRQAAIEWLNSLPN
jgi:hypothetical protein